MGLVARQCAASVAARAGSASASAGGCQGQGRVEKRAQAASQEAGSVRPAAKLADPTVSALSAASGAGTGRAGTAAASFEFSAPAPGSCVEERWDVEAVRAQARCVDVEVAELAVCVASE